MLCVMQPSISLVFFVARAHCWLMFSAVAARTPGPFSAELLSSQGAPSTSWGLGLVLHRCRTLQFPSLNFRRFPLAHFSSHLNPQRLTPETEIAAAYQVLLNS